jgi:hypothetical protein
MQYVALASAILALVDRAYIMGKRLVADFQAAQAEGRDLTEAEVDAIFDDHTTDLDAARQRVKDELARRSG